ncbi:PEP-CTERM sorting domain-containing protein [Desulfuromonas acetoxidans]|uniref:Ice-binding protein C-terminal domain-containing protein n=1 Tax=Desulfuromonas acetoxidans (strain DSM 684 / 11070) TaxID=281689 RepID=Q1K3Y7_DESA6|nr:PEP-CTERM sorting domain-containing protein [Desulfuromonas acetoxidans]EAT17316.1 hypothetical protein Dace_3182 [Desulfuromonas acetoxidans DSM 684]
MKNTSYVLNFFFALALLMPMSANALAYLPNPTEVYDGYIPAAIMYDEFYSYNLWLLDELANNGPVDLEGSESFTANAGVGGQDIVLYTQAGGTSNLGIGPDGTMNFEDPVNTNTGVSDGPKLDGYWGQNDQNNDGTPDDVNGPATVGQVLDYLHAYNPDNDTPVFLFDVNQTNIHWLWAAGQVKLLDDVTGTLVESWSFDIIPDGNYNPVPTDPMPYATYYDPSGSQDEDGNDVDTGSYVYVPGELEITGASGTSYDVDYNGSGFSDYALYSPTMDLSLYDPNDLFVVEFHFDGLNNGGEEFFLTGYTVPGDVPPEPIPEPSSLILLGGGLLGLGAYLRRRK